MARYYKKDGKELPSVTTITGQLDKPALVGWAANSACNYVMQEIEKLSYPDSPVSPSLQIVRIDDLRAVVDSARSNYRSVSKDAMDIGSRAHDAVDQYLKTGREPFKPEERVLSAFLSFLEWKDSVQFVSLETEKTVYGPNYAGTCDMICMLNGKKYLIDLKTSSGIYPEMRYQVAAYRQTDPTIEGCGILRLDKKEGFPEWKDTSATYDEDRAVFNILADLWWASHPLKRRQYQANHKKEAA